MSVDVAQRTFSPLMDINVPRTMKKEVERLRSFEGWNYNFVAPADLASAGFYSLRDRDMVQCAFCRGIVGDWEVGDEPLSEHARHFRRCPFVLGLPVGNVPTGTALAPPPAAGSAGVDVTGNYRCDVRMYAVPERGWDFEDVQDVLKALNVKNSETTVNDLGIVAPPNGAMNSRYSTYEARLRSFRDWPTGLAQKPDDLARAGFYYMGVSDHVKCFHCSGTLRNWDPNDAPWFEHAKWFSECGFVKLALGDTLVNEVNAREAARIEAQSICVLEAPQAESASSSNGDLGTPVGSPPQLAQEPELNSDISQGVENLEENCRAPHDTTSVADPSSDMDFIVPHQFGVQCAPMYLLMSNGHRIVSGHNDQDRRCLVNPFASTGQKKSKQTQDSSSISKLDASIHKLGVSIQNIKASIPNLEASIPKIEASAPKTEAECYSGVTESSISLSNLQEEVLRLKEARLCRVCMGDPIGVLFLPCAHLVTCVQCAPALENCPLCRQAIKGSVRTFLP